MRIVLGKKEINFDTFEEAKKYCSDELPKVQKQYDLLSKKYKTELSEMKGYIKDLYSVLGIKDKKVESVVSK